MSRGSAARRDSVCLGGSKQLSVSGMGSERQGVLSHSWRGGQGQAEEGLVDQVRCLDLTL